MFFYICLTIVFLPFFIIFPVKVVNKKRLPKKGKVLFASNHQSNSDAIIIAHRFSTIRRFKFMAKSKLFKNKFVSWFLKKLGAYPITQNSSDISAIKTTMTHLKSGQAVCVFPEGTRLVSNEKNDLKNGVAMIALRTKTPIVPSYFIKHTKPFSRNILVVGESFNLSEMEEFKDKKIDKELLNLASKIVSKKMFECRDNYFIELHRKNAKYKK